MQDTIAALSTPVGVGALAVVRLSGEKAFDICDKIFRGKKTVNELEHSYAQFGRVVDPSMADLKIDDVVVTKFKAPQSYTGENIVEISCHGGNYVVQKILAALIAAGARTAQPGEFTRRAFLNGKLDLLQAEAVADVIHSQTEKSLALSSSLLAGELSKKLDKISQELRTQCSLLELELDFADEDVEFADRTLIKENVDNLLISVDSLLNSFDYGKLIREGVNTVIVGKPNSGKSSLLNLFLKEERAIVTEIPGTTRDSLEESVDIGGIFFKIIDTAGLRETNDVVELAGIERTKKLIFNADIILYVVDLTAENFEEDVDNLKSLQKKEGTVVVVLNKIDLANSAKLPSFDRHLPLVRISAKTGEGFQSLENLLIETVDKKEHSVGFVITKTWHKEILLRTKEYLVHAKNSLAQNIPSEFTAADLRAALDCIGELTGKITAEDLLNDIFSKFCIGK